MAFSAAELDTIILGQRNIHLYTSIDTIAAIDVDGYFNTVAGRLKQWDLIFCVADTDGTVDVQVALVTSATGVTDVTTVFHLIS
jgi:hypothetical protein